MKVALWLCDAKFEKEENLNSNFFFKIHPSISIFLDIIISYACYLIGKAIL